jgi:hypothetical protein
MVAPSIQPAGSKYDVRAGQFHETRRNGTRPAVTVLIAHDVLLQTATTTASLVRAPS